MVSSVGNADLEIWLVWLSVDQHLNTTQVYARIYDQTLYRQFREATARLDGLAASEWQQMIRTAPVEAEVEVA
jgi:hypothetical protein